MAIADVDLGPHPPKSACAPTTFGEMPGWFLAAAPPFRRSSSISPSLPGLELHRRVERFPFVPADPAMLADNCYEAYTSQVQGLAQRTEGDRARKAGDRVSGGLIRPKALIVAPE